jgi:hypothetical protein
MVSALLAAAVLTASPEFAFAFSNETGEQLLALTPLGKPTALTKVSCDGTVLDVTHLREQPEGPKYNGRQTARNFTQIRGSVFKVAGAPIAPDAMCLLGTEAAFASRKLLKVTLTPDAPCDEKSSALAAALGKRKVAACLTTGTFPGGALHFARFAPKGSNALVGVILSLSDGPSAMRAFPAKVVKDSPSCWRVDDGCEFDPSSYRIVFAMSGPAGWELFALWGGAESQNVELLRIKGTVLSPAVASSRYWSPE